MSSTCTCLYPSRSRLLLLLLLWASKPLFALPLNSTMIHYGMPRFGWTQAVLAWSSFTLAQHSSSPPADSLGTTVYETSTTGSIASATVSGATSTYSIPFTGKFCSTGVWGHTGWTLGTYVHFRSRVGPFVVPASADIGPNILPNIKDPNAKQAQVSHQVISPE